MIAPGSMWRTWYEEEVQEAAELLTEEDGSEAMTWDDYVKDSLDELIPVEIVDD